MGAPSLAKPVNPAIAAMRKEKKPVSPFLRGKSCPVDLAGASGTNKHLRFDEDGKVVENGIRDEAAAVNGKDTEKVKSETSDTETKTDPNYEDEEQESPKTPVNGDTNSK